MYSTFNATTKQNTDCNFKIYSLLSGCHIEDDQFYNRHVCTVAMRVAH